MSQSVAEAITIASTILLWLYSLNGLLVGWLAKYFSDGPKPTFVLLVWPKWCDLVILFAAWLLGSVAMASLTALSNESRLAISILRVAVEELSLKMMFFVVLEEVERLGIYYLFSGVFWAAVWLNSLWFGITHLAGYANLMVEFPWFALLMPVATAAIGLVCLSITLRVGLLWAIGVHFFINSFPLVVMHESNTINYVLFFASVVGLTTIGLRNIKQVQVPLLQGLQQ